MPLQKFYFETRFSLNRRWRLAPANQPSLIVIGEIEEKVAGDIQMNIRILLDDSVLKVKV